MGGEWFGFLWVSRQAIPISGQCGPIVPRHAEIPEARGSGKFHAGCRRQII